METSIILETQSAPFWDWRVAFDLFFGGAGVGAFLFAVGMHLGFRGKYPRICQTAAWLAPVFVSLGIVLLLLKLGRPHLFFLMFTSFAPTAPLWWGGIFQTLFLIGSIWYALRWRRPDEAVANTRVLGLALAPLAVIVGGYHGLLLAVLGARPLWNHGPTVVAAVLSFASTGIAAVMLTHLLRMWFAGRLATQEHVASFLDTIRPVRNILGGCLVLQLGTFFLWWLDLRFGALQAVQALEAANAAYGTVFWGVGIGVGLVIPLLLGAYAVLAESRNRTVEIQLILLTSALILIGGFVFRLAVVLGGQMPLPVQPL